MIFACTENVLEVVLMGGG